MLRQACVAVAAAWVVLPAANIDTRCTSGIDALADAHLAACTAVSALEHAADVQRAYLDLCCADARARKLACPLPVADATFRSVVRAALPVQYPPPHPHVRCGSAHKPVLRI
ncbi:hypothetical protein GX586_02980 [bacterium]|nr:hypothetical protein [bacterium]